MTEKRFRLRDTLDKNIQCEEISNNGEWITHGEIVNLLNSLSDENEQLKKQLREEQCRTTPITLTTHISDDDFKKIELMLKKYFEDLE